MAKKIITVLQQKGGAGKTTIAVHLACMLKEMVPGLSVTIADADPQASATKWLTDPAAGVPVVRVDQEGQGQQLKDELGAIESDVIILDLPPSVEAVTLRGALFASVILVPVGPSKVDLDASVSPRRVCAEAVMIDSTKAVLFVPTRVRMSTSSGRILRRALEQWGRVSQATLGFRSAFSDSALAGQGVNQYAPGTEAYREMYALTLEVAELIGLEV